MCDLHIARSSKLWSVPEFSLSAGTMEGRKFVLIVLRNKIGVHFGFLLIFLAENKHGGNEALDILINGISVKEKGPIIGDIIGLEICDLIESPNGVVVTIRYCLRLVVDVDISWPLYKLG